MRCVYRRADWAVVDGGDAMKLNAYVIASPCFGSKQWSIMGKEAHKNAYSPLVYLQRPKWIKDDVVWQKICESIQIKLPKNFEVK
jgi:hypothetical protein